MGFAHSGFYEWPVTPEALRWGMRFLHDRYRHPLYVTENGTSLPDRVHLDGAVHYPARIPKDSAFWYRELIQGNGAVLS